MRPLSIPTLLLLALIATGFGTSLAAFLASRGGTVPITGPFTGLVMLVLAAVLLVLGLPLRRYMRESEQRRIQPTVAPRRHQLDLPTAFRTVVLARACAYTGTLVAGIFAGQALHLLASGTGSLWGAVAPTAFGAACAAILAVLGAVVERWGTLPPQDGESPGESEPA